MNKEQSLKESMDVLEKMADYYYENPQHNDLKALTHALSVMRKVGDETEMAIIVDRTIAEWEVKPNGFVAPITNIARNISSWLTE